MNANELNLPGLLEYFTLTFGTKTKRKSSDPEEFLRIVGAKKHTIFFAFNL